ncbi:laminin subunit alpha-like [Anneissia japonica]|uniref:laminin subunit alpha-like n=1 Tax=Anneissia japonica TaxID=1529436 RepID=UPI0014254E06|nr:laminin subunit alpha-like [Anneissia japonica]
MELLLFITLLSSLTSSLCQQQSSVLTPPYFNIAEGKSIEATSTCGDEGEPERYCKLAGNTGVNSFRYHEQDIVDGQYCDYCDSQDSLRAHPAEYAIDGTEKWWQSPPLSRSFDYSKVNITIDLGQLFNVAYVIIKFANSPRPGVWVLEKSVDYGESYEPWQYFADTPSDCFNFFGIDSDDQLTSDDDVICTTEYSAIVPLEDGEIVVSLINGRPGARTFYDSPVLQEFTSATNVRLRLIQTKTLLGHLMAKQQQDPTVTRRYFYSIKDISIGGRCVCNGHANSCDTPVPGNPERSMCTCSHNTCGAECEQCCPGFVQKEWRPASPESANECEPCNCYGHSNECVYDEGVALRSESIDIHGNYSGGGVCTNCRDNTQGINCNECIAGFYRVQGEPLDSPYVCRRCECDPYFSTGNCAPSTGLCECKPQFTGDGCSDCSPGYYSFPECKACDCHIQGTHEALCQANGGQCPCKYNYGGLNCDVCAPGFYNFPECTPCGCNFAGIVSPTCEPTTGQCRCQQNFAGRACDQCSDGYYSEFDCVACDCDTQGTVREVCNKTTSECLCKSNFAGSRCDRCAEGLSMTAQVWRDEGHNSTKPVSLKPSVKKRHLWTYTQEYLIDIWKEPEIAEKIEDKLYRQKAGVHERIAERMRDLIHNSITSAIVATKLKNLRADHKAVRDIFIPRTACSCDVSGTGGLIQCNNQGQCPCQANFGGMKCDSCNTGYYRFPECLLCGCRFFSSNSLECDQLTGQCDCLENYRGRMCDVCNQGFYNFPKCEECDCAPAGVQELAGQPLGGCGAETKGACICKRYVVGRSCDTCAPLYWNLQSSNPDGCENCNCFTPGTISGSDRCDTVSGQCFCKLRTSGRICNECEDGAYQLSEGNSFGCTACNCDIGGAVNNVCNKFTGNCICKPRIRGQNCDQPEFAHYFADLYQYKYEIELGQTTDGSKLRIGYDQTIFPDFSYIGYAIMSDNLQPSVILNIPVEVPDIYRIVLRYMYSGAEPVYGTIRMIPRNMETSSEQESRILFKTGGVPQLVTVEGNFVISPFVLNRDYWRAVIDAPSGVMLDYLVLLPSVYFEARILKYDVTEPCVAGQDQERCNYYTFPRLEQFDILLGQAGYYTNDNGDIERTNLFSDITILEDLGVSAMAYLSPDQPYINVSYPVDSVGNYVFVIEYYGGGPGAHRGRFDITLPDGQQSGYVVIYNCNFLCRGVVMDTQNRVKVFNLTEKLFSASFSEYGRNFVFALSSIVAVPADKWSMDLITPSLMCVRDESKNCLPSGYVVPVQVVRIEAEKETETDIQFPLPSMSSDKNILYYMDTDAGRMDLQIEDGNPGIGRWVFVVHYYQPLSSSYDVFFDLPGEVESSGHFKAKYCPNTAGCRTVVFNTNGGNTFDLLGVGSDLQITLPNGDKRTLWIDYILAIPEDKYSDSILKENAQDRTGDFIRECGSQDFYISQSASGFCRDSVFSLTTAYNNGALSCDCNIDGSLNYYCEELGGQCPCREHVTGRQCDRCLIGFYGFPLCAECRCLSGVCNEENGQCTCPPNVAGEFCDQCLENHYGYDPIAGCVACDCDERGTLNNDLSCDDTTGQCNCKQNVADRQCSSCNPGYHSYPFCKDCRCNIFGTQDGICNQTNAECLCKENVEGDFCSECKQGTFSLEERNPRGCTSCFCFGITTECQIATVNRGQVNTMDGWNVTNLRDPQIRTAGNRINVYIDGTGDNAQATIYWVAPAEYLGDKIGSYGGKLRYRVENNIRLARGDAADSSQQNLPLIRPDVILSGNGQNLMYSNLNRPVETGELVEIDLLETSFQDTFSGAPVSRQTLMLVLADLSSLQIQAQYYQKVIDASLSDVSMDTAVKDLSGVREVGVESCRCPAGYEGLSCQDCAEGYYRRSGSYLGICVPCECHNHADSCDPNTGRCLFCDHNTEGLNCESCSTGFYGDARRGTAFDCQICPCPFAVVGSTFASTCQPPDHLSQNFNCDCLLGYKTENCSVCENGYYGNPDQIGGYCEPCFCNGNLDPNAVGNICDGSSGACLLCLEGFAGYSCNECANGFYGDAVRNKNCSRCNCNSCGTERCDNTNGFCNCKRNVMGETCDRCRPNTWNFNSCGGCESCSCAVGSVTEQCDEIDGSCSCLPGVEGVKCDRCQRGHWDYGPAGCQKCNCPELLECEADSGKCICPPGATGKRCDRCAPRYVFTPAGCMPCDSCVHTLLDILDDMLFKVNNTKPGAVAIGLEAFSKIDDLNNTLYNELKVPNLFICCMPCDSCVHTLLDILDDMLFKVNNTKPGAVAIGLEAFSKIDNLNNTLYNELKPGVANAVVDSSLVSTDLTPLYQLLDNVTMYADGIQKNSLAKMVDADEASLEAVETSKNAVDLEKFINDTFKDLKDMIENQRAMQIEGQTEDIQRRLEEARAIVSDLESTDFSKSEQLSLAEKAAAEELLEAAKNLTTLSQGLLDKILEVTGNTEEQMKKLQELIDLSGQATNLSMQANQLNNANAAQAVKAAIASAIDSFGKGSSNILSGFELLDLARKLLQEANDAYQKLQNDFTRLDEGIKRLDPVVEALALALGRLRPLVTQSGEHAKNLTSYAMEIVELSKVGTAYAEQARKAANAYKDIVDAIDKADTAAKTAKAAADKALADTSGVGDKAKRILKKGRKQKKSAEELKEEVDALGPKLEATKQSMEELSNINQETSKLLQNLREGIANLPNVDSDAALKAVATAMSASNIANETKVLVQTMQGELSVYTDRLAGIDEDVMAANNALDQAEAKLDKSGEHITTAGSLMQDIQSNAAEVDEGKEGLKLDISEIKRLVQQARGAADQIKVAVSFAEEGAYVKARSLPASDSTFTKVSFNINNATDGLLFFNGGPTKQDDFIASEIIDGHVNLIYRLGTDEPTRIKSNQNINDQEWHEITITRLGSGASISIATPGQTDDVVEGTSESPTVIFDLAADSSFFFGGFPNDFDEVPESLSTASYQGTIQEMYFDDHVIGLWNFETIKGIEGVTQRPVNSDEATSNIGQFNGDAYLLLGTKSLSTNEKFAVSLVFKSIAANGLLFYAGDENSFLSLSLRSGKVVMNFMNGEGVSLEIESDETYNDGNEYNVMAFRDGLEGRLSVGAAEKLASAQGTLPSEESINAVIQIGGLVQPSQFPHSDVVNTKGFLGCIRDIIINGIRMIIEDNTGLSEGFYFGCQHREVRLINLQRNGFVTLSDHVNLGLQFKLTLSFRTYDSSGVIFNIGSEDLSAILQDSILQVNGKGSSDTVFALSGQKNVSDGNWHVLTLVKQNTRLALYVDDVEVGNFNSASTWSISGGQLSFGSNSQSNVGFIGCVADVILDTSLVSFSDRVDDANVEFGSCVLTLLLEPSIVTTTQPPLSNKTLLLTTKPMQLQTCALQPPKSGDVIDVDEADKGAIMFSGSSRVEYADGKVYDETNLRKRGILQFEVKTTAEDAMIYYAADRREIDFVGVNMADGKIVFRFDCGSGVGIIESESAINDGNWHSVQVSRNLQIGEIFIDGVLESRGESPSTGKFINNLGKQYVGGLPDDLEANDMPVREGFIGCMKNMTFVVDGEYHDLAEDKTEFGISECRGSIEDGAFFNDGYIILREELNVYRKFYVDFEFKPRVTDGVLMSIRTKLDFFVIELVGGMLVVRVDNGNGPFNATSDQTGVSLCDGQWHSVNVAKLRSLVTVMVDNIPGVDGQSDGQTTATNTKDPLYLGGVPDDSMHDGITTDGVFVGCIKNVFIKQNIEKLNDKTTGGNVQNFCPRN